MLWLPECKVVILSLAHPPPSTLAVANGRVPVVERVYMLGFGVNFLGHITPWRPRDPTLVQCGLALSVKGGSGHVPRGAATGSVDFGSTGLAVGCRIVGAVVSCIGGKG